MRPGLLAFAAASGFVGAALYINLVEQPARLALDARSMVREWVPSNRRGFVLLSVLAIISACLASGEFAQTGDVRWLIGGTVVLASCALQLLCCRACEHLAVRNPRQLGTFHRARANVGVGLAGMGRDVDRLRWMLLVCLGTDRTGLVVSGRGTPETLDG